MHPVSENAHRRELAEFLRSRRERLTPAAAGLHSGKRRRTPGLRREEVAELAGIGSAWYTWLEQGRDIWPSKGVLLGIARALQLNETERKYFLGLALEGAPRTRPDEEVTPALFSLLAGMATPAFMWNRRWDVLAYNEAANALFDFDYMPHRNFLRSVFTPAFQALLPNWENAAKRFVGIFRLDNAGGDPRITPLVDELRQESPQFRDWWGEQVVSEEQYGPITLDHPFAGRLTLECTGTLCRVLSQSQDRDLGLRWEADVSAPRQAGPSKERRPPQLRAQSVDCSRRP